MGHGIPHPALGPPTMTRQLRPQSCLQHAMAWKVEVLLHQPLMAVLWCGFPDGHLLSAPPVLRAMCGDEVLVCDTRSEVWMYMRPCTATEACMNTSSNNFSCRHGLLITSTIAAHSLTSLCTSSVPSVQQESILETLHERLVSVRFACLRWSENSPPSLIRCASLSIAITLISQAPSEVGLACRGTGPTILTPSYEEMCPEHLETFFQHILDLILMK